MNRSKLTTFIAGTALTALAAGCAGPATTNKNTNINTSAANTNVVANANVSPVAAASPLAVIEAREPANYRATLVLRAETAGGQRALAIPQLTAEVARREADYRVSFRMPNGEQVAYLDRGGTRYIILPGRKQYAEVTSEAVGFEVPRLMMPSQIINYLGRQTNFRRVGEEQVNGRTTIKYAGAEGVTRTGTRAGDVSAESFVYVDKETLLPVRTELFSEATGDMQGVKGVKVVTELRDINTSVDPSLFEVPQGMNKVSAEQVRRQVDAAVSAVTAVAGALLSRMNAPPASPTPAVR